MALSAEAQQNIDFSDLMGIDKVSQVPVTQTRERINHIPPAPHPTPVAEVVNTTVTGADIPVRIYIPPGEGPFPVVSYFHGGGFVLRIGFSNLSHFTRLFEKHHQMKPKRYKDTLEEVG